MTLLPTKSQMRGESQECLFDREGNGARRNEVTCPQSCSQQEMEPGLSPASDPESHFLCYIIKAILYMIYSFNVPVAPSKPRWSITSGIVQGPPRSWESYNLLFFWLTLSWVQVGVDNLSHLVKTRGKPVAALTDGTPKPGHRGCWEPKGGRKARASGGAPTSSLLTSWSSLSAQFLSLQRGKKRVSPDCGRNAAFLNGWSPSFQQPSHCRCWVKAHVPGMRSAPPPPPPTCGKPRPLRLAPGAGPCSWPLQRAWG